MALLFALSACSGARKYFKAAERLEKQGLVNDAANYYLEALQRRPTFVDARIKLKEVGQKHVSALASDFFRNFNTQQLEASLTTFENLQDFYGKAKAMNVELDFPKTYEDDYKTAVERYCAKNYANVLSLMHDKKYSEVPHYISKITKYNVSYKKTQSFDIIATCEPLYQKAITYIENKNYANALNDLSNIKNKTDNYKDAASLYDLCIAKQNKTYILFQPPGNNDRNEQNLEEYLFNNFSQTGLNYNNLKLINNSPFQNPNVFNTMYNNANVDLIQAIRKASGADYYYLFDVSNRKENNSGLSKTTARAYKEVKTRINDSTVVTEFKPVDYNTVKANRSFAYDFKYKIIDASSGQISSTAQQSIKSEDAIEYNEFTRPFEGDISSLYSTNTPMNNVFAKLAMNKWRNSFTARNTLKSMDELKNNTYSQNINLFKNSLNTLK